MLVDLSQPEIATLNDLLTERATNGPTITATTLQMELLAANASYKSAADYQQVTVSGATLNVERRGKYNWVSARGVSTVATITAIAASGINPFVEGDQILVQPQAGFWLQMQLPTQALAMNLIRAGNFVAYTLTGGEWAVLASNPEIRRVIATPLERVAVSSATLAVMTDNIGVRFITGETPAGGEVEITTAGASGSVSAYVDQGFGLELLGTYAYTGSPSLTDVATGLAAAINAGYLVAHNYAASSALGVVTVIPPDGLGALADTYLLSTVDTGDCVSVAAGFGVANGGTDAVAGVEANGTISELLTPAIDGTVIEITNEMATATLTLAKISGVGDFATSKALPAKSSCRIKYNSSLGEWTHFV